MISPEMTCSQYANARSAWLGLGEAGPGIVGVAGLIRRSCQSGSVAGIHAEFAQEGDEGGLLRRADVIALANCGHDAGGQLYAPAVSIGQDVGRSQ